jgi:hypothetical protein
LKYQFLIVLMIMMTAALAGCLGGDDDGDNEAIIMINGKEYTIHDIFEDLQAGTITGSDDVEYTGVSLEDLLLDAGVADIDLWQYNINASDGYSKNITHLDLKAGILVKEDVMTVFPDLPGKYRVRDIVSIVPVEANTITINGDLYTWMQPFDIFTATVMSNDTLTLEGVLISDLLNGTEITNPQDHNFTIMASDGYQKEVTWNDLLSGILVPDDMKTFFPDLDKKYHIKYVVKIEVV